jgi:hypothetical protein
MLRMREDLVGGPYSTMRPPYITATFSAKRATSPKSWVTKITDVPVLPRAHAATR